MRRSALSALAALGILTNTALAQSPSETSAPPPPQSGEEQPLPAPKSQSRYVLGPGYVPVQPIEIPGLIPFPRRCAPGRYSCMGCDLTVRPIRCCMAAGDGCCDALSEDCIIDLGACKCMWGWYDLFRPETPSGRR
jgi:hypothetical protein